MGRIVDIAQRLLNAVYARSVAHGRRRHQMRSGGGFAGADHDRITATFTGSNLSSDAAIKASLRKLRARSRELAQDNDYARKFLAMVKANVIGASGITLQARVKLRNGEEDREANTQVETAWREWGQSETCTVTRGMSWRDLQRLVIEAVARDGEAIVRIVRGFDNAYGIALQPIEADHLDEQLNRELSDGHRIVMGVELNQWREPVAYHLLTRHPGEYSYGFAGQRYDRIPAQEILHLYLRERPGQTRGVPWMASAIRRLSMLGGYEEAELVAARVAAAKMGFFKSPDGTAYTGDGEDAQGNTITEAEPGTFEQLPDGMEFQPWDPQHPTSAFDPFVKQVLRGAASGLNVAYNTLANDLAGVNFSSIRSGVLEEREQWRVLQAWVLEQLSVPVYAAWLPFALSTQHIAIAPREIDRLRSVVWQPRGWPWVDPVKDAVANTKSIALGVQTRAEVAAAQGRDLDDIFEQLAREQARAAELGIDITPGLPGDAAADGAQNDTQKQSQQAA